MKPIITGVSLALLFAVPVFPTYAANITVDCTKSSSVNSALAKFDRAATNTLTLKGACIEDVVVSAHRDLTILGTAGASITSATENALTIKGNSRVNIQDLGISGLTNGVYCDDRSTCLLKHVTITASLYGFSAQKQSSADIDGTSSIDGSGATDPDEVGTGIGVFGASSVNIAPGAVISHNKFSGLSLLDGSFLRADGATISDNFWGVFADRGSVLKLLGPGSLVTNNTDDGVHVRASTAQIGGTISNNGGNGISILQMAFVAKSGVLSNIDNVGKAVYCDSLTTSVTSGLTCTNTPPKP